jgi:hypothetical protein
VIITFNPSSADSYRRFLQVRQCPIYRFRGSVADVPDEYASLIGAEPIEYQVTTNRTRKHLIINAISSRLAAAKRKYAIFADVGLARRS